MCKEGHIKMEKEQNQYIRMCDCPEVQKQKDDFGDSNDILNDTAYNKPLAEGGELVWLPQQDEIQEMIGYDFPFMARQFSAYVEDCMEPEKFGPVLKTNCTSMRQFWLALYMLEKHKKVWYFGQWKHIQIWNQAKNKWENAKPEEKK